MDYKVIIAGSRTLQKLNMVEVGMSKIGFPTSKISYVISGNASGVDRLGEAWAKRHAIKIKKYPANWEKFGRSAGYKRNELMSRIADVLVAFWDGKSKGTEHMIKIAREKKLSVIIYKIIDGNKLRRI